MREIRIWIFAITTILLAIGVVMIYSSSAIYAYEGTGDTFLYLRRHLLFLAIGAVAGMVMMFVDYRGLRRYSRVIVALSLVLLVMVLVPSIGSEAGGARRWFKIADFSFQPAEMAKFGFIVYLADFLSRKRYEINRPFATLLPLAIVTCSIAGLILLQPDLGTVVLMALMTALLLVAANIRLSYVLAVFSMTIPVFYFLVVRVPYRWNRIMAYLDPWQDPKGTGFQIIQSFLAFGTGGLFGLGLGMSRQKLFYLPEAHTDFIFSIIGEEMGVVGTVSVIALFAALIWQGMRIVLKTEELFGRFLSLGIVTMVALEVTINIGVTIGALPTKGLPLPFISYGGTALIFHMMAVGLLLNISKASEEKKYPMERPSV